jgi:8-amino-7-oxononanoate synthase
VVDNYQNTDMGLFDKFNQYRDLRDHFEQRGVMPFGAVTEKILSPTEAIVNGQEVILAGTNNYLGLTFAPEAISAAQSALAEQGTGTTGSRMANGTFAEHILLEKELAEFFGKKGAMLFSTGFAATSGVSATLAGPDDIIMLDADCHASIYDGVRLSGAEIIRFRHNDPGDLDKRLRRLGGRSSDTLIIVEGIYSMLGDVAPLAEIAELKRKYGAYLMVDEAHSMGVMGNNGRGAAEDAGIEDDTDFVVGTFSKSLGSIGGYCSSDHEVLELLRFATRSYVFTASSSPSVIASTRMTLQLMRQRPELREQLWENARRLYTGVQQLGFEVGPQVSPVVAVRSESTENAIRWWEELFGMGIFVNLVIPPASPAEYSLLRCSISAAHSRSQIEQIIAAYATLKQ